MDHIINQLSKLTQLPEGTSRIIFEGIDLSNTSAAQFEQLIGTLPPSIDGLIFDECELGKNPDLASLAHHLPTSVKSLGFMKNELFEHQSTEVLQQFMEELPVDFEELSFESERIPLTRNENDIPSVFAKLPAYLGKLQLIEVFDEYNALEQSDRYKLSTDKIIKALTDINSANVELVVADLFSGRTDADIRLITQTLAATSNKITVTDLYLTTREIDAICSGLHGKEIAQFTIPDRIMSVNQKMELQNILQDNKRRGSSLMSCLLRSSIWADKQEQPTDGAACSSSPDATA